MYLQHFGLNEPPFKITPVTSFFYSGANRGEILDALIYAITGSEGIIKVTGEVGSGKTMLSRMLLERLPLHVEPVYLANPSLSREEMLYAIADIFGLNLEGQRVNIILQTIQNLLEEKLKAGKRVVILVDEAHAMPLDTLEELRLLYNLQVGDHKLLQIVLFGQPELNEKLDQPNMRQLKDRIVHHFTMQPLAKPALESYLMFRMRAAGFRGSNIFSAEALKLIGNASQGLLRRTNVLADKSLLAAFVEDANRIEARHVQIAIRDSDLVPGNGIDKATVATATALAAILILAGGLWSLDIVHFGKTTERAAKSVTAPATPAITPTVTPVAAPAATPQNNTAITASATGNPSAPELLQQRIDATKTSFAAPSRNSINIQLFYTENIYPARMESFLERADKLGVLDKIYVLPIEIKNRSGYRVLYGSYPNIEAAKADMQQLPPVYRKTYAPTLYISGTLQAAQ